jgi:hypothetical protein
MTTMTDEPYLPPIVSDPFHNGTTIDAGNRTLLRQAPMTANEYMISAIDHIDLKLGAGYAAKHPELIGAFMQASAIDLGTAVIARAIESIAEQGAGDSIAGSIDRLGDSIEKIAAAGSHITEAIDKLAGAIRCVVPCV